MSKRKVQKNPNVFNLPNAYHFSGTTSGSSSSVVKLSETKSGSDNPSWRVAIARRQDAGSPYSALRIHGFKIARIRGSDSISQGLNQPLSVTYGEGSYIGFDMGFRAVPSAIKTKAQNKAIAVLRSKLVSEEGNSRLLPILAEGKESLHLYNDVVKQTNKNLSTLVDTVTSIRSVRSIKGAVRIASHITRKGISDAVSGSWLAWNFGIAPTLGDAENVLDTLITDATRTSEISSLLRFTGTSDEERSVESGATTFLCNIGQYVSAQQKVRIEHTYSCKYVAGISPGVLHCRDTYGLSFRELAPAVWEATPYSWMVDYFSNVSDVLDDFAYLQPSGLTVFCYLTERHSCLVYGQFSMSSTSPSAKITSYTGDNESFVEYYDFKRTRVGALPNRSLVVGLETKPLLKNLSRLANLTSVLSQRVRI